MRVPRIYQAQALSSGAVAALDDNGANHIARVLRLKVGAPLVLFNGDGNEYEAVVHAIGKRSVDVCINSCRPHDVESPLSITLAQGISKGERMDHVVQKAVELGVTRIVPLLTEHCAVNLDGERMDKRLRHWQAVAISACEQCGRNTLPAIESPLALDQWLTQRQSGLQLVLDPLAGEGMGQLAQPQAVTLLIGPEGGLSEREIRAAQEHGYCGVRLGPRILRTETAALAAVSVIQSLWGDL